MTVKKGKHGNIVMTEEDYKWIIDKTTQAEREKVLDDLTNQFRQLNEAGNFRPWNIGHIEEVIREYRNPKQEREP
jgi:hypothetical protein